MTRRWFALLLGGLLSGCHAQLQARGAASAELEGGGSTTSEGRVHTRATLSFSTLPEKIRYADGKLFVPGTIEFARDEATLEGEGTFHTLEALRAYLDQHPEMKVRVEGHTDSTADDQYNLVLSRRRAGAVVTWLEREGIAAGRLSSRGYGEARPLDTNETEAGRQRNRRVEFVVIAGRPPHDDPEPTPTPSPATPTPTPDATAHDVAEPAAPPTARRCPPGALGLHANALGPLVYAGVELAYQPACFLELSLGVGLRYREESATEGGVSAEASGTVLTLPARARFWLMPRHSLIFDAGLGLARYGFEGDERAPDYTLHYERTGTLPLLFAGAGYGFRSNGSFRLALLLGAAVQVGELDRSYLRVTGSAPAASALATQRELDSIFDAALEPQPYLEASFGWLF